MCCAAPLHLFCRLHLDVEEQTANWSLPAQLSWIDRNKKGDQLRTMDTEPAGGLYAFACQSARRRAAVVYFRRRGGAESEQLKALYARLERKRKANKATAERVKQLALEVIRHPLYVALQKFVCLYLHTIASPVRVAITRGLQFRTTFVKLRQDPARFVSDFEEQSKQCLGAAQDQWSLPTRNLPNAEDRADD